MRSFFNNTSVLAGIIGLVAGPALAAQTYLVTDLGNLGGGTASAIAINNNNQVAGTSARASSGFDAFLFSNGTIVDLGNLGGNSAGTALNSLGDVVGSSDTSVSTTTNHPFLFWNGALSDLGLPTRFNTGSANGVNDSD